MMIPSVTRPMVLTHVLRGVLMSQRQQLSATVQVSGKSAQNTKYDSYALEENAMRKTENARRLAASFEPDPDMKRTFPTVSVVTMPDLRRFMHDVLKLRFVKEREGNPVTAGWRPVEGVGTTAPQSGGLELLFNIASKHDYWLVSNRHHHMLYYRLELMRQRLDYLRSVGLDERQKLRDIQKRPPLLVFTMTNSTYHGKLVYLRGLVRKGEEKHLHIYTPVAQEIRRSGKDRKVLIDDRVESLCLQLNLSKPAVLQELFNIPCFFMDPIQLGKVDHLFAHLRSMPKYYNIDEHTLQVMPPICHLESLGITPAKHLRWSTAKKDLLSFPTFTPQQVLDVTYPTHNGKWTPECLSTFLLRADQEELKEKIEGGAVAKPRKGFNVKPRQY